MSDSDRTSEKKNGNILGFFVSECRVEVEIKLSRGKVINFHNILFVTLFFFNEKVMYLNILQTLMLR